jgi:hypothetical protein
MSAVRCAAFRSAALPVGGSRRVTTEVDSSIFAEGFCFLAAPKRGERPHQRQSEPNFSLRLLVSQLSSSPAFLCKPLEHARHVHREKPVSMDFRAKYFMNFLRLSVGQMTIHMCLCPYPLASARSSERRSRRRSPRSHAISEGERDDA